MPFPETLTRALAERAKAIAVGPLALAALLSAGAGLFARSTEAQTPPPDPRGGAVPSNPYAPSQTAPRAQARPKAPPNPYPQPAPTPYQAVPAPTDAARPPVRAEPAPRQSEPYPRASSAQVQTYGYNPAPRQPTYYILAPPVLPYADGVPPPTGYHLVENANTGLRTAGLVIWLGGYLAGLGYALAQGFDDGTSWLVAPVVGPWGALGARNFECAVIDSSVTADGTSDPQGCLDEAFDQVIAVVFLAVDGLAQAAGGVMFWAGAASTERKWVRNDLTLSFGPRRFPSGAMGLGAGARF